jgi:hypothetical protein
MWFIHEGEPPHYLRIARQHLNQTFGEQWIRRRGSFNWPALSPDFSGLSFWLLGHLENFGAFSANL